MKGSSGFVHTTVLKPSKPITAGSTVVVGVSINSPFFENGRFKSILLALVQDSSVEKIVLLNSDVLQRHTLQLYAANTSDLTKIAMRDAKNWQDRAQECIEQLTSELGLGTKLEQIEFLSWQHEILDDANFSTQLTQVKRHYKEEGNAADKSSFRAAVDKTVDTVIKRFVRQEHDHQAEELNRKTQLGESSVAASPESLFAVNVFESANIVVGSPFHANVLEYILEEMAGLALLGKKNPGLGYFAYPQRSSAVPAFIKMRELFLLTHGVSALEYMQLEIKSAKPEKIVPKGVSGPTPSTTHSPRQDPLFANGVVPPPVSTPFYTSPGAGHFAHFGSNGGVVVSDSAANYLVLAGIAHGYARAAFEQTNPKDVEQKLELLTKVLAATLCPGSVNGVDQSAVCESPALLSTTGGDEREPLQQSAVPVTSLKPV